MSLQQQFLLSLKLMTIENAIRNVSKTVKNIKKNFKGEKYKEEKKSKSNMFLFF